jgi:hypothetical protein
MSDCQAIPAQPDRDGGARHHHATGMGAAGARRGQAPQKGERIE